MTNNVAPQTLADARAQALIAAYERAGYARAEPATLLPAEPFLDLSGEDIRGRMYITTDAAGRELCLRPDLTIPVARDYLASPARGKAANFCYLGLVFRQPRNAGAVGAGGQFMQAGVESFGRADTAVADAEMIALGVEASSHYGVPAPQIRMGDVALFAALVAALDLTPTWRHRLVKDFNRKATLARDLEQLSLGATLGRPEYQGVLAALANSDPRAARALVTDFLSIAGIAAVGGRTVGEIADRFLEQATRGAGTHLPRETGKLIEQFLAIHGEPERAAGALRALAAEAGISLGGAIDHFERRIGLLAARGIDPRRIRFATAFGRRFDYYTGLVFELHDERSDGNDQLVAGGRYDGLLTQLGAPDPIAAVGFAIWIERLAACGAAR
ncbi:MAG: ATP phosphoribosyltransferase regulatory subunit [Proteobacteria bacterium]|nr:ATP phosphoribosyltransferase regulatory subunit [Pseudomonadota bacterium]